MNNRRLPNDIKQFYNKRQLEEYLTSLATLSLVGAIGGVLTAVPHLQILGGILWVIGIVGYLLFLLFGFGDFLIRMPQPVPK